MVGDVVLEYRWPPKRILASLSFPTSGSGFREAVVVGGRAACPPAPAHPPLTVALRFALVPLPPTRTECQEGPVAGAWEPLERRLCAWAQRSAGGCSLPLACPFPRAGQLRGAPMSRSGCGPGAPSLGTPGPGVSLSLKVWVQVSTLASGSWRAGPGFLI